MSNINAERVDTPAPAGRRERKKAATRDRIFECAMDLFASRGYDSTTIEDIGECADVARATVFNYFRRKEDFVLEWFARRRAEVAEVLTEDKQETTDTPSRLRRAFAALGRMFEEDPATGRAMVRAWLSVGGPLLPDNRSDAPALFADTVRLGQEQGDIPQHVDPTRAGLVLFDAYLGVLYRWVSDEDGRFPFKENMVSTVDLVLAGIARENAAGPGGGSELAS